MKIYKVIGLMSGTSLDGLDLAYCHFWKDALEWQFKIVTTKSISYKSELKTKLKSSINLSASELLEFNNTYGVWLGEQTKLFITEKKLEVDFIASHGHTTHHQPEKGFTFQIGSGQHIANTSGLKTISDFRTNDISLGGQGAPLVPIGDKLLFSKYDFCINLGGISNVSFEQNSKRIAYDIGLANMALNHVTQKIDLEYDKDGALAKKGKVNQKMLQQLNQLEYYNLPYPKSTGYEWFLKEVVPIIDTTQDSIENLLHTIVMHICSKISLDLKAASKKEENTVLVTGGGALNEFLMSTLQEKLGSMFSIKTTSNILIEFKEAMIFAFMGVLRNEEKNNVLASVTGAKKDSSSGVIYIP